LFPNTDDRRRKNRICELNHGVSLYFFPLL
jgi:hypothetical protein